MLRGLPYARGFVFDLQGRFQEVGFRLGGRTRTASKVVSECLNASEANSRDESTHHPAKGDNDLAFSEKALSAFQ